MLTKGVYIVVEVKFDNGFVFLLVFQFVAFFWFVEGVTILESWSSIYSRKDGKTRFRWFGHSERRPVDVVVMRVGQMEYSITRGQRQ